MERLLKNYQKPRSAQVFAAGNGVGANGLEGRALRLYLLFLQLPPSDLTQRVPSLR
jgi:hypothetical protein